MPAGHGQRLLRHTPQAYTMLSVVNRKKEKALDLRKHCARGGTRTAFPTYVRDVDGRAAKWCIEWYYHPEALSRVEALWRAWEHPRLDGATGISVWWKNHADHHMSVLMDPRGPFYKCDMQKNRGPEHLEPKKAPNGWFPDVRAQQSDA
jgi:hypothetical protein